MSEIGLPNQTCKILHIMAISLDSVHIFQNRFLRWNRESKPVDLNTMNPIIWANFFSPLKGSEPNFGGNSGGLRKLRFGWNFFCELIILFLMGKWFVFNSFWHFNLFGQPYCRGSSLPIELILIPKHYSWKYNTSLHHTYTSSCYIPPI